MKTICSRLGQLKHEALVGVTLTAFLAVAGVCYAPSDTVTAALARLHSNLKFLLRTALAARFAVCDTLYSAARDLITVSLKGQRNFLLRVARTAFLPVTQQL